MPEGWEIVGELGRGAQGKVYRVRHHVSGVERALKVLDGDPDPEAVARFRREGEALARLGGHGVVPVHATGVEGARLSILMDFMPGGSLADRLAGGRLPWREAATVVAKLARTVERAAALGLVHRDLKPANVLIDELGEPRISDWGCARDLAAASLTETGAVIGTPAYMAPEQLEGKKVGASADAFALGVVLHEALTGEPPFPGRTAIEVFRAMKANRRARAAKVSGCPAEIDALLDRALAVEPGGRASAAQIAAKLETAVARKEAARPGKRVALALGVAALVASALFLASRRSAGPAAPPPVPPQPPSSHRTRPFETERVLKGLGTSASWVVFDEEVARVGTATIPAKDLDRILLAARVRLREEARVIGRAGAVENFPHAEAIMDTAAHFRALGAKVELPNFGGTTLVSVRSWEQKEIDLSRRLHVLVRVALFRAALGVEKQEEEELIEYTARTLVKEAPALGRATALSLVSDFADSTRDSAWSRYARARLLLPPLGEEATREEGERELRQAVELSRSSPGCAGRIANELPFFEERGAIGLGVARELAGRLCDLHLTLGFPHLAMGRLSWLSDPSHPRDEAQAKAELDRAREQAQAADVEYAASLWGTLVREEGSDGPRAALDYLDEHVKRVNATTVRFRARLLIESGRRAEALSVLEKAVALPVAEGPRESGALGLDDLARRARESGDDDAAWSALAREIRTSLP